MRSDTFFDKPLEQSLVKTTLVTKYFNAWANVIMPTAQKNHGKIAYVDLFAGSGRYDDGSPATPLRVIEQALKNPKLCQMLVMHFNDKNSEYAERLEQAITDTPDIERLKHRPTVSCEAVGDRLVEQLERVKLVPTLFFVDPWGYKGMSLRLIESVVKDWGCDCLFFFNYNRINAGVNNPSVAEHMRSLFGEEETIALQTEIESYTPEEREVCIIEYLSQALRGTESQRRYVLPFRFRDKRGTRTSHHLIFVSKHVRGYEIMKDIMAKESTTSNQGVASFEYNEATQRQPLLFDLTQPIDDLAQMLCTQFAGQTLSMQDIYQRHHVGTPYVKKNYKTVLLQLEANRAIRTDPAPRRLGTFADTVQVTFPAL